MNVSPSSESPSTPRADPLVPAEPSVRSSDELERLLAERTAELRASEAKYRTLVEHAPEAIVALDGDTGRFVEGNETALRLFRVDHATLLTLLPSDLSPPTQPDGRPSRELALEKMRQALEPGGLPMFEWMHRDRAGRDFMCEVRVAQVPVPGRTLFIATVTDITERKAVEAKLTRFAAIAETTSDRVGIADLQGRLVYLNPAGRRMSGFALDEDLSGRTIDNAFTPESVQRLRAEGIPHALRTGTWEGEVTLLHPDGTEVPVLLSGVVIRDAAGNPEYLAAVSRDMRPIKLAEKAMRENEARFRALFENSTAAILVHDEHEFLQANPAAVQMFRAKSAEDLLGSNPVNRSPAFQPDGESTAAATARHIAAAIKHGRHDFEWVARRLDGTDFPMAVSLSTIPIGGRMLIQAVMNDLTETKKAEAELLRSIAREKELSELKSHFISTVSHEFRTPLGVILSAAQILQRYHDRLSVTDRAGQLEKICRHIQQLTNLINEVLMLGKVESGRMECKPAPINLRQFCTTILDEVESATDRACPIQFTFRVTGATHADEQLLTKILTNLLSNAVKYSPPGEPVEFTVERDDREAVFTIRDHGIGIPEEDLPKLFGAFHRARNVGQRPGSGLGLAIVKECVNLHGGTIAVTSQVGAGTTMTVRLPLFSAGRKRRAAR